MANTRLFRGGDLIPVVGAVILAAVLWIMQLSDGAGACVRVQTPHGEQVLSLSEDTEREFIGYNGLTVTVAVQDGKAWVRKADCPDQVCVHTGRIGVNGRTIACLPAGIVLTVASDQKDAPDAVAR